MMRRNSALYARTEYGICTGFIRYDRLSGGNTSALGLMREYEILPNMRFSVPWNALVSDWRRTEASTKLGKFGIASESLDVRSASQLLAHKP